MLRFHVALGVRKPSYDGSGVLRKGNMPQPTEPNLSVQPVRQTGVVIKLSNVPASDRAVEARYAVGW